ncbi:MAG TPA: VWA domain-containing protein [Pyrinomonadaceae bacterium]|jgi:VWFA-related protein|nr:VWA domain-containing protein [Pyrinomonadaceae bacterium]
MFSKKQFTYALATLLIAVLFSGVMFTRGARAQQQQQTQTPVTTQQDRTRPRRAVDSPRTTTPPQQTESSGNDTTLQDDDDVVRVETDLTNILFTAVDKQKRFITTLKSEDVRILEDGQPQEIFAFQRQTDIPLSLAILIDTSASEERTLPAEKSAASAFVDAVLRPGKDEVAVVSFTGDATLEQGLTGNVSRVRSAIDRVEFVPPSGYIGGGQVAGTPPISGTNQTVAGSTAIWDAIYTTTDEELSHTSDKTRRAIILLTDGVDTYSRTKMSEAIDRAVKADTVIYSIGIGDDMFGGIDEGSLKKVSERTGGRAFFPRDESELRAAFGQIQEELRSQYLVAYSPTNKNRDGSYRRVQIEVLNPDLRKNLRLTYRQGYFAKTPGSK